MRDAKLLIEQVTEMFPPGSGQHHNLTVQHGNLVLCLMLGDRYQPMVLEDDNFTKSVDQLVSEIAKLMKKVYQEPG